MNKVIHSVVYGLAGLLLYIPGAVIVCLFIATWYEVSRVGPIYLLFPAAYFVGSFLIAMATGPKFNLGHFVAFLAAPVSGAIMLGLLLYIFPHDKGVVTLGAPVIGLAMWVTAKLSLRHFKSASGTPAH